MNRLPLICTFIVLFFQYSCNLYESPVPISEPSKFTIDRNLIGHWKYYDANDSIDIDTNENTFITIIPFNEHEYLLRTLCLKDSSIEDLMLLKMHNSFINKREFFNVLVLDLPDTNSSWTFFRYDIAAPDSLIVYYLTDSITDKKFDSSRKLYKYLKTNFDLLNRSFVEYGKLKRVDNILFK
ncbi:MAG: hypothetical protein HY738_07930 [Bacteroidia bacterium]|nr:hypothetical protein [Bacteroidia bacterium]